MSPATPTGAEFGRMPLMNRPAAQRLPTVFQCRESVRGTIGKTLHGGVTGVSSEPNKLEVDNEVDATRQQHSKIQLQLPDGSKKRSDSD